MGRESNPVELDVDVLVVGENSLIVSDGDNEARIPFSLIDRDESDIDEKSSVGDSGTLVIPEWKALDAGLI